MIYLIDEELVVKILGGLFEQFQLQDKTNKEKNNIMLPGNQLIQHAFIKILLKYTPNGSWQEYLNWCYLEQLG